MRRRRRCPGCGRLVWASRGEIERQGDEIDRLARLVAGLQDGTNRYTADLERRLAGRAATDRAQAELVDALFERLANVERELLRRRGS